MGRPREFDVDSVLEIALNTFWKYGFEKTSITDLTTAMKIHKKSLYDTFVSKEHLFKLTLDLYVKNSKSIIEQRIKNAPTCEKKLRAILFSTQKDDPNGCFLVNTTVELSSYNYDLKDWCSNQLVYIEELIYSVINDAIAESEISSSIDARATAIILLNTWCGIRVLYKTKYEDDYINTVVNGIINTLFK